VAIKKVVYMLITEDYELTKQIKQLLENSKGQWKFLTKYYDEKNLKEPVKTTTEQSY